MTPLADTVAEMFYGPPNSKHRRRTSRELALRHFRKLIVEVAIIVGVLMTVGIYVYASVVLLERLG